MSDDEMGFDFDASPGPSPGPANSRKSEVASNDSFDSFEAKETGKTKAELIKRYQHLKEESTIIDNAAVQVRSLMLICRQMEKCYSKRIVGNQTLKNFVELRYLFDGSLITMTKVTNLSDQLMTGWNLVVSWRHVCSDPYLASGSQTIPLENLRPGVSKSYGLKISLESLELPIVLYLKIMRPFELDEICKIFRVELDPICLTYWDLVQSPEKTTKIVSTGFEYSIRLPHSLIDLLCGCPDTISTSNVFRAILPSSICEETDLTVNEITLILPIEFNSWQMVKLKVCKESTYYSITVFTENSKTLKILKVHMQTMLIVEMAKLKSRPENCLQILPELTDIDQIFESMIAAFS